MKKLALIYVLICSITSVHNTESRTKDSQIEEHENPSDIASVSKFITDFHRQFEDEVLTMVKRSDVSILYAVRSKDSSPATQSKASDARNQSNTSETSDKNTTSLIKCNESRKHGRLAVEVVNSTRLIALLTPDPNVTSRLMPAECQVLLFYLRTCPFSCLAAPHFNALPRAFPSIRMTAFNAMQFESFNIQFGIAGVPTVMLFHNGRPAAKFNDSEYTLEMFSRFITRFTGVKPAEKMFVTSSDFGGPVPSVLAKEPDYLLGLAWAVIIIAAAVGISKSTGWRKLVETIQNTWREAQAEHEHNY